MIFPVTLGHHSLFALCVDIHTERARATGNNLLVSLFVITAPESEQLYENQINENVEFEAL